MTDEAKLFIGAIPQEKIKLGVNLLCMAGKDIILIRQADTFTAFENRCPHRNKRLFSDETAPPFDQYHLECEHHGAIFELPRGECISGPCPAEKLTPITVIIHNNELTLYLDYNRPISR